MKAALLALLVLALAACAGFPERRDSADDTADGAAQPTADAEQDAAAAPDADEPAPIPPSPNAKPDRPAVTGDDLIGLTTAQAWELLADPSTTKKESPATVWAVLTDFARYPEWNGYTHIEGAPEAGGRLRVSPGPDAGRMPTFRPRVLRADPERELRWRGKLFVPGLYDGEHSFRIEARDEGGSRLVQSERFSGLLVGPINRRYGERTERTFRAVNEALKARAEARDAAA